MMGLLARNGQRSAALTHYETCRRLLEEELGVAPMAETQVLFERLKSQGGPVPSNLPLMPTPFVGREPELAQTRAMLANPACRLLTILGAGGIGKTRLALQLATGYVASEQTLGGPLFSDGVYFISMTSIEAAEALVPALAEALGFTFQQKELPHQQLFDYLRHKTALLVLDNLEQGLITSEVERITRPTPPDVAALIIKILETAPQIKILTTSRIRLNVQGEYLFTLAGLDLPEWPTLGDQITEDVTRQLSTYSAIQLFLQSARRVQADFVLKPNNIAGVAHICHLAQGMPLGIELAAAWIEILNPAEIAAEISQNLDFLEATWRDVPERQRSIRAVFNYSWNLLNAHERELFQQLAIFQGEFSRQAAQTVTGASLRELMTLVNKSLLHPTSDRRYTIHALLRQFGVEKLDASPLDSQMVRDRHCAYYGAAMKERSVQVRGPGQEAALLEIEAEHENIRVAWQWAVSRQQVTHLRWMCDPLSQFYSWRGRYQEGQLALNRAVVQLRGVTAAEDLYVLAKLLTRQSVFNRYLGRAEVAYELLQESLALWDKLALAGVDVQIEKAFALLHLGETLRDSNRLEAKRCYEASLALFQAGNFAWGMAQVLASLGWLIQHFGAYDEAKELYQKSLVIHQALENQAGVANSLMGMGGITLYQGYPAEAEPVIRESIALRRSLGDQAGLARSLSKLGEVLIWLGKFKEAEAAMSESLALYFKLGLREAYAFSETLLGIIALHLGMFDQAQAQGEQALAVFHEIDSPRGVAYACLLLGGAALAQQQFGPAESLFLKSLAIYRELGQRDELAQALALLGYARHGLGNLGQGRRNLIEALQTALEIRAFMPMMLALPAVALLAVAEGQADQALGLHTLLSRYPFVANSDWFEQVAGARVTQAAATLSPPDVAAAKEKGSALSLEEAVTKFLSELTVEN
jgi:predicted ATPase